jgi:hypothetical protein
MTLLHSVSNKNIKNKYKNSKLVLRASNNNWMLSFHKSKSKKKKNTHTHTCPPTLRTNHDHLRVTWTKNTHQGQTLYFWYTHRYIVHSLSYLLSHQNSERVPRVFSIPALYWSNNTSFSNRCSSLNGEAGKMYTQYNDPVLSPLHIQTTPSLPTDLCENFGPCLRPWLTFNKYLIFCWPWIIMYHNNVTNLTHFHFHKHFIMS